jgi:hypothetical protein
MPEQGWIIYYEDVEGPRDQAIFLTEESAKARVAELLSGLAGDLEKGIDPKDWEPGNPFPREARRVVKRIRAELKMSNIWDALSVWEEFDEEYEPIQSVGTIRLNKADVYR